MSKTDTGKAHDADKQVKNSSILGETSTNTSETTFGESGLQSSVGTGAGAGAGGEGNSNQPATVHRYANTLNQIPSRNVRQNNLSKIQRSHGNQFTAKVVNRYSQSTSIKRTVADPAAPQQEFAPTVDLGQPGLEDLRALLEKPWDLAIHPEHLPSAPLGLHNPPTEIAQVTPTNPTEAVTNGSVKATANTPANTTHQPATGHTESHGKDHHDAAKATHTKEAHKASAEGHAKLNQHAQHLQNQAEQHKGTHHGHSEVASHAQAVNQLAGQHQQQNQQTATAINEKVKQQVLPDVTQPVAHEGTQAINQQSQAVQAFIPAPHQAAPEVLPGFAARIAQSEAAFQPTLYKQAGTKPAQGIDPATGIDWNSFNLDNFVNQLANGNPNAQIVSTQQSTPTQTQPQATPTQTPAQPTPTQTQSQPQPTVTPTGTPTPGATNTPVPAQHPANNGGQSHSLFYEGDKYVGPFSDYDNLKQHAKDINTNTTHDPKFKPQPSANPFTTVFDSSNWDIKKNKDGQDATYKQENAGVGGMTLANTVLDWRSKRNHSIPTADQPGGSYAEGNKESAIGKGTPTTYTGPAQANAPQQTLVGSQPAAPTSVPQNTDPTNVNAYNGGDFQVQADTRKGSYSSSQSQNDANGNLASVSTYSGNGSLYTRNQTNTNTGSSSSRLNQRGEFDNSTYKAESTKDNVTTGSSSRLQGNGRNWESSEVDGPNKTSTTRSGTSGTWTASDYKTNKYAPNSKEYMRDGKEEDVTYNEKYAVGNTSQTSVKQTTGNTTTTTKTGSSYNTDWRDTSNQNVKYNNNPLYTQDGKDTEATSSVKTGTGSRKSEDWSETAVTGSDSVTKKKSSTTIDGTWDETSDSRVTYNGSNRDNKLDETTNKASTGSGIRTTSDSSTETKLEDYKPDKNSYAYTTEKNSTTNNSINGTWQDKDVKQTNYGQNNKDGKSSEIATNVKSGTGTQTVATTGYDYKNQQVDDKSNTIDSVSKKDSTTTTNGTWKDTTNQRVSYNNNFQTNPDGKTEEITDINKSGAGVRTQQDVSDTRTNEVRTGTLATTTTNSEKTSTTKIQGNNQDEAWNESTSKTTNYDAARNKDRKVSDTSTSVVTGTGTRTTTDYTKETDKVETWDSATAAYTQRGNKYTKKETATDGSWNDTDTKSTQYSDGTNAPLNKDGKLAEWSQTNKTGKGTRTTSDITDTNLREQYIGPDGVRNSTYTTKNNTSNTKGDWNESNTKIVDYSTDSPNNKDFKLRETSTYSKGGSGTLDTYDRSTEDKVEQRNGTSATVNTISTKDSGSTLNGKWNNSESKTTDYGGDNRDDKVFTATTKSSSGAGTYTQTEKSREDNRSESYDDSGNSTVESKKNTYKTTTIDGTDENGNPANWRNEDTSYTQKDNRNWEKTSNVKSGTGTLNETEDTTETRKDVDNGGRVASNFDKTTTKTSSQNGTWDNVSSTQKRDGYRYDSSTVSNWGSGTRDENSTSVQKGYQKGTGDDARDYTDTTTRSNKTIQGSNWTNTEASSASFGGGLSYSNKTSGMAKGTQYSRDYQSVRGKPGDEAPNPARPKQDEVTIWQQDYQGPQHKASHYSEDNSDPNHTSTLSYTDGIENTYSTTGYAKVTDRNVSVGGQFKDTYGLSGQYTHTDKGKIGGVNVSNDFSARGVVGVDTTANGSVSLGLDGLQAKGDVSVRAGLSGTLTDKTTFGDAKNNVTNNAQVDGLVGGEAKASGQLGITTDGVMATGDASAFAGAKVTGSDEMSLTIDGHKLGSVTVSGEASAGIGASAKGTFSIDWKTGTVTLGGSLAATLGVGLGAGVEVKLSFKELAALGIDLGGQLLGSIKDKVVQGVQNYLNAHPQVKAAVEGAINMAKSFGASAVSFGKDAIHVISDMGHTIAKVGGEAWHLITHPGEAMKAFGSMANQAGQMMSNAFNDVVNWATPGVQSVLQFGQNLVNGIGTGVNNLINFGKGVVGQIGDLAQGALKFGGDVLNNISNMAQGAIQFGGQVISNIGNMAQGLWSFGSGVVNNIGAGFNNLVSFGGQMLSNVGQWFGNLGNIGSGLVSFAADKLAGLGSLGDSVLSFLEGLVSKAKSVVGWIPGVGAALDAVQHKLEQGRQIINAAINGAKPLQGKASAAASKASSVASAGISTAQSKAQSATQAGQTAKQTVDTKVQSAHQTAQAAHQTAQGVVTASNAAINSEHQKTQAKVQQTNQAVNQEHTQMQTISQGAMAAVSGLVGTVQGKATAAHSKTSTAWTEAQTVAAGAQGIVTGAWSKVTSFANAALASAEGRASQVQATASAAAGLVGNQVPLVQKAVDTAHSTIEKGSQAATQKAETTWNTASNFIKGEATQVGAGIAGIGNTIKAGGQAATAKVEQMAAHADGIVAETGARIQAAGKQGPAAVEAVIEGAKAQLTGIKSSAHSSGEEVLNNAKSGKSQAESSGESAKSSAKGQVEGATNQAHQEGAQLTATARGVEGQARTSAQAGQQKANEEQGKVHQQVQSNVATSQQQATQGHAQAEGAHATTEQKHSEVNQKSGHAKQTQEQAHSELAQAQHEADNHIQQQHSKVEQAHQTAHTNIQSKMTELQTHKASSETAIHGKQQEMQQAQTTANQTIQTQHNEVATTKASAEQTIQSQHQSLQEHQQTAQSQAQEETNNLNQTHQEVQGGTDSAASQINSAR